MGWTFALGLWALAIVIGLLIKELSRETEDA